MCHAQCYDGAANVKRIAHEIKAIEPMALCLHYYGHSLNLAAADTLQEVKPMADTLQEVKPTADTLQEVKPTADTLDYALEIRKLLKFSSRRDAIFNKLKQEITPNVPGLRTLGPTHWTVRAASLESIRLNYLH